MCVYVCVDEDLAWSQGSRRGSGAGSTTTLNAADRRYMAPPAHGPASQLETSSPYYSVLNRKSVMIIMSALYAKCPFYVVLYRGRQFNSAVANCMEAFSNSHKAAFSDGLRIIIRQ